MWMNLHTLPANKSMYTLFLSDSLDFTEDSWVEEIDVVAPSSATLAQVKDEAKEQLADYDSTLVIVGVSNQSDGYWVYKAEGWN